MIFVQYFLFMWIIVDPFINKISGFNRPINPFFSIEKSETIQFRFQSIKKKPKM